MPDTPRYRRTARVLHWTMAAIVIPMVPLGIAVGNLPWGDFQTFLFNLHKSLGIVVLALVLVRIGYRLTHRPPPLPPAIPRPQRLAAEATHIALYAILLALPVIGWVGTNAFGEPMKVFWSVTLPALAEKNTPLSDTLWTLHKVLGLTLGVLILGHAGAALAHRFLLKDTVLGRMWPP